jgi:hypothetical protein
MTEPVKSPEKEWLVNAWIVRILRLGILVLSWSAIILSLIPSLGNLGFLFSTYTIQSNLLILIWLSIAIFLQEKYKTCWFFSGAVRGAITLYITVTFIIFALLLAPLYHPTGIEAYTNLSLHYIIPIAFLVDWVLTEMYHVYQWKYTLFWLSYPIFYLILTLILGSITGTYIYPFLDLNAMGTEFFVIVCIILTAFFILLGSLLVFLNKTITKRLNRK